MVAFRFVTLATVAIVLLLQNDLAQSRYLPIYYPYSPQVCQLGRMLMMLTDFAKNPSNFMVPYVPQSTAGNSASIPDGSATSGSSTPGQISDSSSTVIGIPLMQQTPSANINQIQSQTGSGCQHQQVSTNQQPQPSAGFSGTQSSMNYPVSTTVNQVQSQTGSGYQSPNVAINQQPQIASSGATSNSNTQAATSTLVNSAPTITSISVPEVSGIPSYTTGSGYQNQQAQINSGAGSTSINQNQFQISKGSQNQQAVVNQQPQINLSGQSGTSSNQGSGVPTTNIPSSTSIQNVPVISLTPVQTSYNNAESSVSYSPSTTINQGQYQMGSGQQNQQAQINSAAGSTSINQNQFQINQGSQNQQATVNQQPQINLSGQPSSYPTGTSSSQGSGVPTTNIQSATSSQNVPVIIGTPIQVSYSPSSTINQGQYQMGSGQQNQQAQINSVAGSSSINQNQSQIGKGSQNQQAAVNQQPQITTINKGQYQMGSQQQNQNAQINSAGSSSSINQNQQTQINLSGQSNTSSNQGITVPTSNIASGTSSQNVPVISGAPVQTSYNNAGSSLSYSPSTTINQGQYQMGFGQQNQNAQINSGGGSTSINQNQSQIGKGSQNQQSQINLSGQSGGSTNQGTGVPTSYIPSGTSSQNVPVISGTPVQTSYTNAGSSVSYSPSTIINQGQYQMGSAQQNQNAQINSAGGSTSINQNQSQVGKGSQHQQAIVNQQPQINLSGQSSTSSNQGTGVPTSNIPSDISSQSVPVISLTPVQTSYNNAGSSVSYSPSTTINQGQYQMASGQQNQNAQINTAGGSTSINQNQSQVGNGSQNQQPQISLSSQSGTSSNQGAGVPTSNIPSGTSSQIVPVMSGTSVQPNQSNAGSSISYSPATTIHQNQYQTNSGQQNQQAQINSAAGSASLNQNQFQIGKGSQNQLAVVNQQPQLILSGQSSSHQAGASSHQGTGTPSTTNIQSGTSGQNVQVNSGTPVQTGYNNAGPSVSYSTINQGQYQMGSGQQNQQAKVNSATGSTSINQNQFQIGKGSQNQQATVNQQPQINLSGQSSSYPTGTSSNQGSGIQTTNIPSGTSSQNAPVISGTPVQTSYNNAGSSVSYPSSTTINQGQYQMGSGQQNQQAQVNSATGSTSVNQNQFQIGKGSQNQQAVVNQQPQINLSGQSSFNPTSTSSQGTGTSPTANVQPGKSVTSAPATSGASVQTVPTGKSNNNAPSFVSSSPSTSVNQYQFQKDSGYQNQNVMVNQQPQINLSGAFSNNNQAASMPVNYSPFTNMNQGQYQNGLGYQNQHASLNEQPQIIYSGASLANPSGSSSSQMTGAPSATNIQPSTSGQNVPVNSGTPVQNSYSNGASSSSYSPSTTINQGQYQMGSGQQNQQPHINLSGSSSSYPVGSSSQPANVQSFNSMPSTAISQTQIGSGNQNQYAYINQQPQMSPVGNQQQPSANYNYNNDQQSFNYGPSATDSGHQNQNAFINEQQMRPASESSSNKYYSMAPSSFYSAPNNAHQPRAQIGSGGVSVNQQAQVNISGAGSDSSANSSGQTSGGEGSPSINIDQSVNINEFDDSESGSKKGSSDDCSDC